MIGPLGGRASALLVVGYHERRSVMARQLTSMGFGVVHQAAQAREALWFASSRPPCNLAVVDLELASSDGCLVVAGLRSRGWPSVTALLPEDDNSALRTALEAGATGYFITKRNDSVRYHLREARRSSLFTPRQVDVLRLVAEGMTNKAIGSALNLSESKVKSELITIGRRLGAHNRAQIIIMAMRAGIVS